MANGYACLARWVNTGRIACSRRPRNDLPAPKCPGELPPADAAYLIADILSDNDARSLAFGAESSLRFDFPVACKTGTSSDFRDNWALATRRNSPSVSGSATRQFPDAKRIGRHRRGPDSARTVRASATNITAPTWYSPPTNIIECWINPITGKKLREPEPLWTSGAINEKVRRTKPSLA